MPKKVIFLDRDGTINVDSGFVHSIDAWEWTDGALDALERLQKAGYILAVVTNQSGIAHGMYEERDMHALHEYMNTELEKRGIHIDVVAFCPHGRDENICDCRKPDIGMARQVEEKVGEIDYGNSWTIGDKEADIAFGKKAGTKTALIRSQYWTDGQLVQKPDLIVDSLKEATGHIVGLI